MRFAYRSRWLLDPCEQRKGWGEFQKKHNAKGDLRDGGGDEGEGVLCSYRHQQSNLLTFTPVDHTRESPLPEIFRSPVLGLGLGRQKAEKRKGRGGRVPLKGKRKQITHPFQAVRWVPPGVLDPQFPQGY